MIKFENLEVMGWNATIRGMRNPMNSWEKSDTIFDGDKWCIGPNDLSLMNRLCDAGTDHRKFMRMIAVYVDITAPLYWWKEFDTYKVGTVANSCSTMHKITAKKFTVDDFSFDKLIDDYTNYKNEGCFVYRYTNWDAGDTADLLIDALNHYRDLYLETKDKKYWWQIIQLLPSSYNQKRTIVLNYEVLSNIYKSRKTHKLDEWLDFCKFIETLPYSELITRDYKNNI